MAPKRKQVAITCPDDSSPGMKASQDKPGPSGAKTGKYVRLDQRQHVLLRPNTYVGSTKSEAVMAWMFDESTHKMVYREIHYVPGLLQIFDEILVNAIDHSVRLKEEKQAMLRRKRERKEAEDVDDKSAIRTVQTMKNIYVVIDRERGRIEIMNDGEGIDVDVHVEDDGKKITYIPELIFGNMLTSANYDDDQMVSDDDSVDAPSPDGDEKERDTKLQADGKKKRKKRRVIGGQNGVGAKACNILSRVFEVETVDRHRKLRYKQIFRDNMADVEPPTIEKVPAKTTPYTKISFLPDYSRFGMDHLTSDMYDVFVKRVLDATAVSDQEVAVHLNGVKVECKSFENYIDLYLGPLGNHQQQKEGESEGEISSSVEESSTDNFRVYEKLNDWWEIAAACSDGNGMQQVSFVNGLWTIKGGSHVNYICSQIVRKLTEMIASKRGNKDIVGNLKPQFIRDNLFLFVKCTVPNPEFDSQTKDELKTPPSAFDAPGGKVEISRPFLEKLYKTAIVQRVMSMNEALMDKTIKKTDGKKQGTIYGITKLEDANWAGGPKSHMCTLILTEGDSAKTMAMGGLDQEARDRFGVFPLRGKVMNVCNKMAQQVMANVEIQHLKTILGLETGRKYDQEGGLASLRYGRIMIMTDQDADGSHIKGLLFNLFHQMWPSLLRVEGFFTSLLTPIVKATKRTPGRGEGVTLSFYSMADYHDWMTKNDNGKGYDIKYYKGLGTSTRAEAKQYFKDLKTSEYFWTGKDSDDAIGLAFDKSRADDRKNWLMTYDKTNGLDFGVPRVSYPEFINKDLIHFSNYDVVRSIPSVCDGLKPSQRKIVFASFKRNLVHQIKVAQLAGYVSEKAAYHHGEDSLNSTIVGLAQDFVGSNNINLLQPVGQFGSRTCGGKDSSAARYIFTCFNPLTPMLFMREDEGVLRYLDDDGYPVEPEAYAPILPVVLINGVTGIGTGFSSDVPSYNPEDLVRTVQRCLDTEDVTSVDMSDLHPWVRGFKGSIEKMNGQNEGDRYCSRGVFVRTKPNEVYILELPVGFWTSDFKEHVDMLKQTRPNLGIRAVKHNHTDISVQTVITFNNPQSLDALLEVIPECSNRPQMTLLEKELKLVATRNLSTTNMHLYNREGRIQKYASIKEIILEHHAMRLEAYGKRKVLLLEDLEAKELLLSDKIRFLEMVIDGSIVVQKKSKVELELLLAEMGFCPRFSSIDKESRAGEEEGCEDEHGNRFTSGGFDHLIKMPIFSMTVDKKSELEKQLEDVHARLSVIRATSEKDMWRHDLERFLQAYRKWVVETGVDAEQQNGIPAIAAWGGEPSHSAIATTKTASAKNSTTPKAKATKATKTAKATKATKATKAPKTTKTTKATGKMITNSSKQ